MNSCLYECRVTHMRVKPIKNGFAHNLFMFYLDLDEIDGLNQKIPIFGHNRFNIYSFYDADHIPLTRGTLRENLETFLRSKGITGEIGRVMMLSHMRTWGYVFNPLTVYFCFDKNGGPVCAVPEIGNTFGEIKTFVLKNETLSGGSFHQTQEKFYYISPFSALDVFLEFDFRIPDERLDIRVDDVQDREKILYASLSGRRKELNMKNLLWYSLKFPLMTLQVIFLIHLHALIIYLRRVPFFVKEADPDLQKEVLRARVKH